MSYHENILETQVSPSQCKELDDTCPEKLGHIRGKEKFSKRIGVGAVTLGGVAI